MINKSVLSQCHVYIDEEIVYELRYPGRVTEKNTWSDRMIWMCPTYILRPTKIIIKGVELKVKVKVCPVIKKEKEEEEEKQQQQQQQ